MIWEEGKTIFIHIPKTAGTTIRVLVGSNLTNTNYFKSSFGHKKDTFFKDEFPELWKDYFKFTIVRNPYDRLVSVFSKWGAFKSKFVVNKTRPPNEEELQFIKEKFIEFIVGGELEELLYLLPKDVLKNERSNKIRNLYKSSGKIGFRNIKAIFFLPQLFWIPNFKELDYIGRQEDFNNSIKYIFEKINIEQHKIRSIRKKFSYRVRGYKEYYTDETKKIIYNFYKEDFELFGYEF